MEMVAASKMRKTQVRMRMAKPYAQKIYDVVKHIARANSEYRHAFMDQRELKSVGVIVVSTDRGLCGGLNTNIFRELVKQMQEWKNANISVSLATVGKKAQAFFRRSGGKILASVDGLGDTPGIQDIAGVVRVMLDAYYKGEIDGLYVIYNEFVNTMTQQPTLKKLLPLPVSDSDTKTMGHHWDYIYEPEAKSLLDAIFDRYIELLNYQAVVENIASEQASKMIAMKNATENAEDLIKGFQLAYNKARQASITQELAEIVGGASAL